MERLIHVLGRSTKNNAVLVGEPGVGKRAIVEGLAQRIADGQVPSFLGDKRIVVPEMAFFTGSGPDSASELAPTNTLFFLDELYALLAATPTGELVGATEVMKNVLLSGKLQSICTATPQEYAQAREKHRWLDDCFSTIDIPPMTEVEALAVLVSAKAHLEKFHSVKYTDDAIQRAVRYASSYVKDRHLPDKALDLMDEAAAYVNARPANVPDEILELRKRVKFIIERMENSIANHESQKARFYSDEERKERENLRELLKKHNIDEAATAEVTREDVEEVLSRWIGLPVSKIRESRLAIDPGTPSQ
jgi:ATP-dependent Clp protease ATP-binding subunit ClpC